jgi:predicted dehydrogenase
MNGQGRRGFLKSAGAAAISGSASRILGANERVNVGIVGLGGRGTDHVDTYAPLENCKIAAVCDVNQAAGERAVARVEKLQGHKPKAYSDMRQMFADQEVDAVSIATPNHWHALAAIWAMQAGKDVYLEKPACHNVFEGRKLMEARQKYGRMVQVGSQGRSHGHKIKAMQLLRDGVIGKLYMAKGLCYKRRRSIGHTPDTPVPPGINWDLFLGPAQMKPFSKNKFAYNWHWFWDTGNGDIGNQGAHEIDVARWGLAQGALPKSVVSTGAKFVYDDDQETPNTQLCSFDYGDCELVFEVRGLITTAEGGLPHRGGNVIGDIFYGSEGCLVIDYAGFQVYKGEKLEKVMDEKAVEKEDWDTGVHMVNFLRAVRTRDLRYCTAGIEEGVLSASLCHLANISCRTGRKLAVDPAKWEFVGDAEANRMLTRDYRAPYVVPERV